MTQDCLDSHIVDIQCKFSDLSHGLSNALSLGTRKIVCLNRKNVSTAWLLKLLRCYKAFTSPVTFATKIEFNRLDAPDPTTGLYGLVTITMGLGINLFPAYVGTGTDRDIASWFKTQVDNTATAVNYESVEVVGNTIYVYSYDPAGSFSDLVISGSSDITLATSTITNLQNNTDEILDLWNNVTHSQLCKIITFAGVQSNFDQLVTSNSCNC